MAATRLRALLLALALGVSVAHVACTTSRSGEATKRGPETLAFELPDTTGALVKTADYAGRVLLVDIWATWCGPCEKSMPFYADLVRRFGPRGFDVLAVSVDEKDADVAAFLTTHALPFKVLRDPRGKVPALVDASMETMPTSILVGADGKVRLVHAGFVPEDEKELEAAVERALAERPAKTTNETPAIETDAPGGAPKSP